MIYNDLAPKTKDRVEALANKIKEMYPTAAISGRIKHHDSLHRKAGMKEVGYAGLDDIVGYAIIFDNLEDQLGAAKYIHDPPEVKRIYDYGYDDPCGYYAMHCSLDGGVGSEIQLITKRLFVAKEIFGHIGYECLRDLYYKQEHEGDSDELLDAIENVKYLIGSSYKANKKLEGTKAPMAKCDVDSLSEDEKEYIISAVLPQTTKRADAFLNNKINERAEAANGPITNLNPEDIDYLFN